MYEYPNLDVYQHVRILNAGVCNWHMVQNAKLIASCCKLLTCSMFIYFIISFGGVIAICVFSCWDYYMSTCRMGLLKIDDVSCVFEFSCFTTFRSHGVFLKVTGDPQSSSWVNLSRGLIPSTAASPMKSSITLIQEPGLFGCSARNTMCRCRWSWFR